MSENPFADLIPKSAGSENPFEDLIPEQAPRKTAGDFLRGDTDFIASNAYKAAAGMGEAALAFGTGMPAWLVSKAAGLGSMALNITDPEAYKKAKELEEFVSGFYTYQPKTDLGQNIVQKTGQYFMEPAFGLLREMGETPAHDIATNPLLMAATGGRSAEAEEAIKYGMGTAAEFMGPAGAHRFKAGLQNVSPAEAALAGQRSRYAGMTAAEKEAAYRQRLQDELGLTPEQAEDVALKYPLVPRQKTIEMPFDPQKAEGVKKRLEKEKEIGYNTRDEEIQGRKSNVSEPTAGVREGRQGELGFDTPAAEAPAEPKITTPYSFRPPNVVSEKISDYRTHTTKIESSQDVAEIAAANIGRKAQENLIIVTTDAEGKPLAVHRHTVGLKGTSLADPGEIVGLALNTPGAKRIYLAHNHPAGNAKLSQADKNLHAAVKNLLEMTGIEAGDMIAVSSKEYAGMNSHGKLAKPEPTGNIPFLERVYTDVGEGPIIDSVRKVKDFANEQMPDGGIVMLNNQLRPTAILKVKDYGALRGDVANEFLKLADKTNGTSFAVISEKALSQTELQNIQRMANASQMRVVDIIHNKKSALESGDLHTVGSSDVFFFANPLTPVIKGIGNMIARVLDNKLAPNMPGAIRGTGEGFGHTFTRTVQDRLLALKEWEKGLGDIPKKLSAYFTEERMHGKIADQIEAFNRGYVEPFTQKMANVGKKYGTTLDEFDLYLKAKYAPTRNDIITKRNPDLAAKGPGSGMSNAEAKAILDAIDQRPGLRQAFEDLAKVIYDVQDMKLKLIEKYGLESKEVIADMKAQHGKYYVPLKGKVGVTTPMSAGGTFNVRHAGLKAAIGRLSPSENSIIHTFNDLEATIRRVHNNEVTRAFVKLAEDYNAKDVEVNKVQLKQKYNSDTGVVETYNAPVWAPEENTLGMIRMKKDPKTGKDVAEHVFVRINNNPLLVRALKNEQIPFGMADQAIATVGKVTRLIASLVTKWSPEFAVTNQLRDLGDALQGLTSEHRASIAKSAAKKVPSSVKEMYRYFRGEKVDPYTAEFVQNGGTVGFYSGKDYTTRAREIEGAIRRESATGMKGLSSRTAKSIFDLIGDVTGAGENGTRLAVYRALRESGLGVEEAVSYAKNVTVNFNRHGEHRWISQLYMFANPGIQGIKRFKDVATTKKGMAIMGGITATALAMNEANRVIAGEDESGTNNFAKLSPWERSRNIILMNPANGKPLLKIPLGFYARLPFAAANAVSDIAHGEKEPLDTATDIFGTALDAFSPLGSGGVVQSVFPTVSRPAVDILSNKNAFGQPIYPEQTFGADKPDSQRAFKSVSPVARGIAEGLNTATGGSQWEPGLVDVSPETIEYVTKFFTGGPGKNFNQIVTLVSRFYEEGGDIGSWWEKTSAQDIPIVGRVTGARTDYYEQQKFHETSKAAEQKAAEWKGRRDLEKDFEKFDEGHGETAWLGKQVTKYRNRLADINRDLDAIKEDSTYSAAEKREIIKQYEDEKKDLMREYIRAYNDAKRTDKQARKGQPGIFDQVLGNRPGGI